MTSNTLTSLYWNFLLLIGWQMHEYQYSCTKLIPVYILVWLIVLDFGAPNGCIKKPMHRSEKGSLGWKQHIVCIFIQIVSFFNEENQIQLNNLKYTTIKARVGSVFQRHFLLYLLKFSFSWNQLIKCSDKKWPIISSSNHFIWSEWNDWMGYRPVYLRTCLPVCTLTLHSICMAGVFHTARRLKLAN